MRAFIVLSAMLLATPGLATDEDTDSTVSETDDSDDTDDTTADLSGRTASEVAEDEGGLGCNVAATALGSVPVLIGIGFVVGTRRRRE